MHKQCKKTRNPHNANDRLIGLFLFFLYETIPKKRFAIAAIRVIDVIGVIFRVILSIF